RLYVTAGPFCPPNARCFVGPMALIQVELPIVKRDRAPDGAEVITAERNLLMADGDLSRLVIRDNRSVRVINPALRSGLQARFIRQPSMRTPGVRPLRISMEGTALQMFGNL